jgi:hypothetical protein
MPEWPWKDSRKVPECVRHGEGSDREINMPEIRSADATIPSKTLRRGLKDAL